MRPLYFLRTPRHMVLVALSAMALRAGPPGARREWSVADFGAKGDGAALDTGPVNRAIEACSGAGGGTVVFPAGVYKVGTVRLLSNVTLFLDAGTVIRGSDRLEDYPAFPFVSEGRNTALIFADHAHGIAIAGRGTIDGNAGAFALYDKPHTWRGFDPADTRQGNEYLRVSELPDDGPVSFRDRPGILVLLLHCQDVHMAGVRIVNAPNWCLHAACCRDVVFSQLEIKSGMLVPNADGIDASQCSNVRISDCNIEAGDDAIAFAVCADGFGSEACENNVVQNCTLCSRSAAIRVGYSGTDIRNLAFDNIVIHDSNRGIGVFCRASETIENVLFSNIVIGTRLYRGNWWGKGEPILLSSAAGPWSNGPRGRIRNVAFNNLTMEGQQGIVVAGSADSEIADVSFNGIRLALKDGPLVRSFGGNFDLRMTRDEHLNVFRHDIPALYAGHVRNLSIRNMDVSRDEGLPEFFRDGLSVEDYDGLTVDGYRDPTLSSAGRDRGLPVHLGTGRNAALQNNGAPVGGAVH
jgi:polygalacturonase